MNKTGGHVLILSLALVAQLSAAAPEILLVEKDRALFDVVVSPSAQSEVRVLAAELTNQLRRVTGQSFGLVEGDGATGIAFGLGSDFPATAPEEIARFDPDHPLKRETYLMRTHADGLWLLGATPVGLDNAIWDFLRSLGWRQFFPGETWEVLPENPLLSLSLDRLETPSFYQRTIGVGHGLRRERQAPHQEWRRRNRFRSAMAIHSGHAYGAILRANREAFQEHPEYLALVNGERKGGKFCISNPGLRQLVVDHAVRFFVDNPAAESISMEPSDGGGWCQCAECAAMGSISDRVVILANAVAEAVNGLELGTKYVGLLAYNMHSPPPSVRVHSNIVVRAATNGVRGGYTLWEILEGWRRQGAIMGVSDFFSVFSWDLSLPARQKASDLPAIASSLKRYHQDGVRYFNVAISDNWGSAGLGAYLTSRILWDIDEADRVKDLFRDFIDKSFGPAADPMERFFRLVNRVDPEDRRPMIRQDLIARMYRRIDEAYALARAPAIRRRLDDLVLLTRYLDLYHRFSEASGDERQAAFAEVLRHAWRIRDTGMVHTRAILTHLSRRERGVQAVPFEDIQNAGEIDAAEIGAMLRDGIARNEPVNVGFEPVAFSRDLVPAGPLALTSESGAGSFGGVPMGRQIYYTWLPRAGQTQVRASGGHVEHYRHLAGPAKILLYAAENPVEEPVDSDEESVLPDGEEQVITLHSEYAGLHWVEAYQAVNRVWLAPHEAQQPWTVEIGLESHNRFSSYWTLYVYVPRGTRGIGGFASTGRGDLRDAGGAVRLRFEDIETPGYFHVEVPPGQDGKLWQLNRVNGTRRMMTIPPWAARRPEELLLPREVVEADAVAHP